MTAFLKVFTDNAHASEVAHTTNVATTGNGAQAAGVSVYPLATTTGMPTQGTIDIIDGTNGNETIAYTSITGNSLNLATVTAFLHPNSVVVNQWVYILAVGDQVNGILNDGTNATAGANNVNTWYVYNAGNQIAQTPTFATSNVSPSTTAGYADTQISTTSSTTGFTTSVSPSNIAIGGQQQIWVAALIPSGQSAIGNPQQCVLNMNYGTV